MIVSVGYERRSVDELVRLLLDAGVTTLVDVRLDPMSRRPGFGRRQLAAALEAAGIGYVHEPSLGNPRDNRAELRASGPAADAARARYDELLTTAPARAALDRVLARCAAGEGVALLCLERDPGGCHRSSITRCLVQEDAALPVVEL